MALDYHSSIGLSPYGLSDLNPWCTGKIHLRHLRETIDLPRGMRVRYADAFTGGYWLGRNPKLHKGLGQVRQDHSQNNGTIDLLIDSYNGSGSLYKFTMGHEEGHVADFSGNLKLLLSMARELGYDKFDFFPENMAEFSDQSVKIIMGGEGTEYDYHISWGKPHNKRELLAHVGGLIALTKSGTNPTVLHKIEESIRTGKECAVRQTIEELF
jgi:hypothetical protein